MPCWVWGKASYRSTTRRELSMHRGYRNGLHTYRCRVGNDLNVLNRRRLGHLVMKRTNIGTRVGGTNVDLEVADLAVKPGSVDIPFQRVPVGPSPALLDVHVGGQNTKTDEAGRCPDGGPTLGVSNYLSAKMNADGARHKILSRREVHNGVLGSRTVAVGTASFPIVNGFLDRFGRILSRSR